MTDPMPGKRYGAIYAWRDDSVWRYLPGTPGPQRSADGRAQLTVVEAGDRLMLTLGTSLSASDAQIGEARAAIAAETGNTIETVELKPADAKPGGAKLVLTSKGKPPDELARATPSPLPPYPAAFSAMLQGDRAKEANAALKSGEGRLDVIYDMEVAMTHGVTARIAGNPGRARDVEEALAEGGLTFSCEADAGATESLKADARQRVFDEAERLMKNFAPANSASEFEDYPEDEPSDFRSAAEPEAFSATAIDAHVTRTEPAPRAVELVANVADWL